MPHIVENCPRCRAQKMTFDVDAFNYRGSGDYGWQHTFETFAICRECQKATVFVLRLITVEMSDVVGVKGPSGTQRLNDDFEVLGFVKLSDIARRPAPEHIPQAIANAFDEGATCLATGCWNAASVMFRMCIDIGTRSLLPAEGLENGPNSKERRDLGLRLPWLFEHNRLPEALRDLAACVHQDGNDGAHQGTLSKVDAEDLVDFTEALLERLYTEPERLRLAALRRLERRGPKGS